MKLTYLLIASIVSIFTIANTPQLAIFAQPNQVAQSEPELLNAATAKQLAAKITVQIKIGESGGSGVLIGKRGNTYLVLTNAHVVIAETAIAIKTPDGQSYNAQRVKNTQVGKFDLALLEFSSTRSYQLARANFG